MKGKIVVEELKTVKGNQFKLNLKIYKMNLKVMKNQTSSNNNKRENYKVHKYKAKKLVLIVIMKTIIIKLFPLTNQQKKMILANPKKARIINKVTKSKIKHL